MQLLSACISGVTVDEVEAMLAGAGLQASTSGRRKRAASYPRLRRHEAGSYVLSASGQAVKDVFSAGGQHRQITRCPE
jgi:hypothetical protein